MTVPAPFPSQTSAFGRLRAKSISEAARPTGGPATVEPWSGSPTGRAESRGVVSPVKTDGTRQRSTTMDGAVMAPPFSDRPPPVPKLPLLPKPPSQVPPRPPPDDGLSSLRGDGGYRQDSQTADALPEIPVVRLRKDREEQLLRADTARARRRLIREREGGSKIASDPDRVPAESGRPSTRGETLRLNSYSLPSPPSSPLSDKPRSPVAGIFSLLTKGRKSNADSLPSPTSSKRTSSDFRRSNSPPPSLEWSPTSPLEPAGKVYVPQIDAPVSASNGGQRDVTVKCGEATLKITVNNETNAAGILADCSSKFGRLVDSKQCALVEVYNQWGLERRVRQYERVRDILNSWDSQIQNWLAVQPRSPGTDGILEMTSVVRNSQAPAGFVLQLYHSQQPARWHKRYVTLLESGQMLASKKPDPGPNEKDVQSLCHLTDFDIYTLADPRLRKRLRQPKKFCYAIKSQQKAAVFVNTDNFVHYFSTDDPQVADTFFAGVQKWRSWYLAGQVGTRGRQGGKSADTEKPLPAIAVKELIPQGSSEPPQITPVQAEPKKSVSHVKVNGHKVKVSVDESPYTIGAFEPLLDLSRFDKPLDEFGKDWIPDNARMSMQFKESKAAAPANRTNQINPKVDVKPAPVAATATNSLSAKAKTTSAVGKGSGTFAANTLLGDSYEQRKQALKEREKMAVLRERNGAAEEGPFTDRPSLLSSIKNDTPTSRSVSDTVAERRDPERWLPSAMEHSARSRTRSIRSPSVHHQNPPQQRPPGLPTLPYPSAASTDTTRQSSHHHPHHQHPPITRSQPGRLPNLPAPLIDLSNKPVEAPQWSRGASRGGHGIRAPEGVPLVDLATSMATMNGAVERMGRPTTSGGPPAQPRPRARSVTSYAGSRRPSEPDDRPPVPRLPTRSGTVVGGGRAIPPAYSSSVTSSPGDCGRDRRPR
ncbi:hypothetical protein VTK73DRAFT_2116 [Phialemonium thermophilum]|uniref:PH domain-containing protein n=1 Tax=Phialemonium thermophilum TaxID=223376 RepID=A0ABR3X6Q3_9PEZI